MKIVIILIRYPHRVQADMNAYGFDCSIHKTYNLDTKETKVDLDYCIQEFITTYGIESTDIQKVWVKL